MDYLEQGMSGLMDVMDWYAKEIRAVSGEAIGGEQKPSSDDIRRKVTVLQDHVHHEALEMYDRLVAAGAEVERELLAKLTNLKETMGRTALVKEVITSTVKPVAGQ